MLRSKPNEPMVRWALSLAARRNRQIAVVALARKLVGILWVLWRDAATYRPELAAQHSSAAH